MIIYAQRIRTENSYQDVNVTHLTLISDEEKKDGNINTNENENININANSNTIE